LGSGARPERAGSIGWASPCHPRIKACFLRRRRGVFSPPHSRRNKRLMIPSGPVWPPNPGIPWPWRHAFLQRTKVLQHLYFSHWRLFRISRFVFQFFYLGDLCALGGETNFNLSAGNQAFHSAHQFSRLYRFIDVIVGFRAQSHVNGIKRMRQGLHHRRQKKNGNFLALWILF